MELKYIPDVCTKKEGYTPEIEGHVVVRMPTFKERYSMIEECGIQLGANEGQSMSDFSLKNISAMVRVSEKLNPYIKEVSLKRMTDGHEYKSFDEMCSDSMCDAVIFELCSQVVSGFKPTKN